MKRFHNIRKHLISASLLGSTLFLAACSDNDDVLVINDDEPEAVYEITITNLTANQPFSPAAVMLHAPAWQSFETGESASLALEHLAEGGSNTMLIAEADEEEAVYSSEDGAQLIGPGASQTLTIRTDADYADNLALSVVSMLVNTNDAITAINGSNISDLETSSSQTLNALSYDTGTEANTESDDTIPGPAASGAREGFNAARDDANSLIHIHQGVVTADDGLATSALDASHRWDHPVMQVLVERIR